MIKYWCGLGLGNGTSISTDFFNDIGNVVMYICVQIVSDGGRGGGERSS